MMNDVPVLDYVLQKATGDSLIYLSQKYQVKPPSFSFEDIRHSKLGAIYVPGSGHIFFYRGGLMLTAHEFWHYWKDMEGVDPSMSEILGDKHKEADRFAVENQDELMPYWSPLQPYIVAERKIELVNSVLVPVITGTIVAAGAAAINFAGVAIINFITGRTKGG